MNQILYSQTKLTIMPIVSHIKVPSLEVNAQGKEILKAKKLIVHPPQGKSRSLSAHGNFRNIFQIPKNKKASKENLSFSNKPSNEKLVKQPIEPKSTKKANFTEIQYLNDLCQQMAKEHILLQNKLEEQEKLINRQGFQKREVFKAVIPKIILKHSAGQVNDDLITFRPDLSPAKKQFRFPREVFSRKAVR